jgi:WD40 repeat protein
MEAHLLDPRDGNELALIEPESGIRFSEAAFNPDGTLVALGTREGPIMILTTTPLSPLLVFSGHSDDVTHLAFSPDGRVLASASKDGTVRFWGIPGGS